MIEYNGNLSSEIIIKVYMTPKMIKRSEGENTYLITGASALVCSLVYTHSSYLLYLSLCYNALQGLLKSWNINN